MSDSQKPVASTATSLVPTAFLKGSIARDNVSTVASEYEAFYDDSKKDRVEERKSMYTTLVNHYYDLATDFYEYGWGQSFHFAPRCATESFVQSIVRHEHYLALKMRLQPGQKIADFGCGVGGPMREIARFSGAHVVGINNNAYQIQRGGIHNAKAKLEAQCSFIKADFLHVPVPDESFDGAYAIEATCHAPDRVAVFSEVFRSLKPGAYFSGYEWVMTSKYNPNDPKQVQIKKDIEEGDGLPDLIYDHEVVDALKKAGFEIVEISDLAETGDIPWYQPLAGSWSLSGFRMTWLGRLCTHAFVNVIETLRVAPSGTAKISSVLLKAAQGLVAGGQTKIFTPMMFFLVRKPERK
ncbi:delta-24-sterol methyltransferase [Capsaspora owczarzaki ATCC 30864]|uniref:Methyltransferase n=1 Tax=Capsaspora owczarzaki (strain ATCC 30864) TaxID=595528 RepID=A0A0D2X3N8_CAPO3|nr:delta-24-sterol methyltransferase [Capsaspora owczarzaki ATCC 30864]KJE94634.1 delta-24-sterol methyltransferase [Capsaspora owczarzaki ATCC 30864]|eukprot:XP_004346937.1 delta-24-sterol methyltransferase [Capsaspora owczarzaki ATCC 30864]